MQRELFYISQLKVSGLHGELHVPQSYTGLYPVWKKMFRSCIVVTCGNCKSRAGKFYQTRSWLHAISRRSRSWFWHSLCSILWDLQGLIRSSHWCTAPDSKYQKFAPFSKFHINFATVLHVASLSLIVCPTSSYWFWFCIWNVFL